MKQFAKLGIHVGVAVFVLSMVLSSVALATADLPEQKLPNDVLSTTGDLRTKITTVLNWVFFIFIAISILFVILAGLQFITAGGDAKAVTEARQKLMYAAVGIGVALIARGLPVVISNILGGTAVGQ